MLPLAQGPEVRHAWEAGVLVSNTEHVVGHVLSAAGPIREYTHAQEQAWMVFLTCTLELDLQGSRDNVSCTRFRVSMRAVFGSVPILKITVMVRCPSLVDWLVI